MMLKWLQLKVGDKPAWAIVMAAMLAALGAAAVSVISLGGGKIIEAISDSLPGRSSFSVIVREASTRPVGGVAIQVFIRGKDDPILLSDKSNVVLTAENGVAQATRRVPPGPYTVIARYQREGNVYRRFDDVEVTKRFNYIIKFDTETWDVNGEPSDVAAVAPTPTRPARTSVLDATTTALIARATVNAPWLTVAAQEVGQTEVAGVEASNPRVEEYLSAAGAVGRHDDTPWDGAFVSWVMKQSDYALPPSPLASHGWRSWGRQTALTPGCIAVFWRTSPSSGLGHVGFFLAEDGDALKILGGNQSDKVNLTWVARSKLLSCRMPEVE